MAGGRSGFLHVWSSEGRQLLRIVQLPSKIRVVRQLLFLPDNFDGGASEVCNDVKWGWCLRDDVMTTRSNFHFLQTLGFLAQDGIMRFINIHSCKLLFQIGSHDQVSVSHEYHIIYCWYHMYRAWFAYLLQMLSFVQVSPAGRCIAAVSESGNILVYEVGTLAKDLHKVPLISSHC